MATNMFSTPATTGSLTINSKFYGAAAVGTKVVFAPFNTDVVGVFGIPCTATDNCTCPPGEGLEAGFCAPCPAGKYSAAIDNSCAQAQGGQTSSSTSAPSSSAGMVAGVVIGCSFLIFGAWFFVKRRKDAHLLDIDGSFEARESAARGVAAGALAAEATSDLEMLRRIRAEPTGNAVVHNPVYPGSAQKSSAQE